MFAVTGIQATVGTSGLIRTDAGGKLSVLTAAGVLTMEVPPSAPTQWPEIDVEFSVAMDVNVAEFEAGNGEMRPISPIVECKPDGMHFKESSPVSISVPLVYSPVWEQFSKPDPEVWVSDSSNKAWHPLLDPQGHTIHPTIKKTANGTYQATFTTPHFTRFVVLFRNRVADFLGRDSLYKYKTARMVSHISKLMDMPDIEGRRLFALRLDFLINDTDTATTDEFCQLTPDSYPIRLPYGDVRVSLDSTFIQPTSNEPFERCIPFYDDNCRSVQFECQTAESCEDMITPEMVLAAVTVSRWRNGRFTNDPVPLKKIRCDEDWEQFRSTVDTKTISDIIHQGDGKLRAFKQLCRSRLSLKELETGETDNPFCREDNDFVGAVARLFAQRGGTPQQFSKALIENLQNERINVELDRDVGYVDSIVNSSSSSSLPDVREPAGPLSYAAVVVADEATGPVSHSAFDKSIYRSLRAPSRGRESPQLSSDPDCDGASPSVKRRKGRPKVAPENRRGRGDKKLPHSSVSPLPDVACLGQLSDTSGVEGCDPYQRKKLSNSTTRECWTPELERRSPYSVSPCSRPQSHTSRSPKSTPSIAFHLPPVGKTKRVHKPTQTHNLQVEEGVSLPPLVSKKKDNPTSGEVMDIPGTVTRDERHVQVHQPETDSNTSQESDDAQMGGNREEKTFCAKGQYVMSGYDQTLSVKHVTQHTINITHCYGSQCPHGSSSEDLN